MVFMKILALIILSLFLSSCATKVKNITSPSADARFVLPNYEVEVLSNGLEVLFLKSDKLPLLNLSLLIPAGSVNDPAQKSGVAYFAGELLKMGTHKRSAKQIASSLEQKGSDLSVSVSRDYTMVEASSLSTYQDELFSDFTEVLTSPRYSWSEFSRFKKKLDAQKLKSLDDASSLAGTLANKVVFKGHPYENSVSGSAKTVRRISQKDVVNYYKKFYQPKGAMLAVVGQFNKAQVMAKLETLVERWPSTRDFEEVEFEKVSKTDSKIHLVHKPGAKQTQIRFTHLGISRNNKDFIPIRVMNAILGRGFSSRLLTEVRVKKGLTYSIGSFFSSPKQTGAFTISTFTQHGRVKETLDTVYETVNKFIADGVTEDELTLTKQYLKGTFPSVLETPTSVAYNIMLLKYLGVPLDYLKTYTSKVDQVTVADVQRVAKKYITPKNLQVILVSDKSEVYEQIKNMGEFQHYKHTDLK